ncbi:MAG: serine hydrolase [Aggregatilineales bacterium]
MSSTADLLTLEHQIKVLISESSADVAVALRSLDAEAQLFINATEMFHAASTMKVAVMVELFAQAELGHLSLDDSIPVINHFNSIVDGSVFSVELEHDLDHEIIKSPTMTMRELSYAMIVVSSNCATNLIMQRIGVENIQKRLHALDIAGLNVLRPLEDEKAFKTGVSNTTNALALSTLLWKLGRREIISERACDEMLNIMKRHHWVDPIPANIPEDVAVANKPGWITKIDHDAGIVFSKKPFVLVVLTRGIEDRSVSSALIGDITRLCYSALSFT